jgi:hypothetical protein
MANKNTIKVRARRLRRAHERKQQLLETISKRDGVIPTRKSMVKIIGSSELLVKGPWDQNQTREFSRSHPVFKIQGETVCLCDHHMMFPEDNVFVFNHVLNPTKYIDASSARGFVEDFYRPHLCLESFLEFLNDLAELD